ncbi:MAG: 50S ribosome-binding GTPase [Planctomycetales bacterium]|nr:50S ribosome-binding GTPase [Planctomycetales bacterium]
MNLTGTIISQLTPSGRGAVASILVAGPQAAEYVSRHFSPASGKAFAELPIGRVVFGSFRSLEAAAEEVVVGLHAPEHLEIHCHGGAFAAAAVMKRLAQEGATIVPWQQVAELFEPDRIAAEARVALAEARTEKMAAILLDQYHGALRKCLEEIASYLERQPDNSLSMPIARLQRLLDLAPLGQHLTQPWRVFIAGAPNVGKSSLMNALVGYQRSIVFDQPGTTRDLLTATTALDGWPIELVDSAGLRESQDAIEAAGVARATAGLADADLVLWVEDATRTADTDPRVARPRLCVGVLELVVRNKADLLPIGAPPQTADAIAISARTGQGLDQLCQQIIQRLIPAPPTRGEAILFTARQENAVREAAAALSSGNSQVAAALLRSL